MHRISIAIALAAQVHAAAGDLEGGAALQRHEAQRQFLSEHPDARIATWGSTRRIVGHALATGVDPAASAAAFVDDAAAMLGVAPGELVPGAGHLDGGTTVPVMYDRATGAYRFTAVYYGQQRGGVPVFRARITLLARNVEASPVVLVNPDFRELGAFVVAPQLAGAPMPAAARQAIDAALGAGHPVGTRRRVIWAGLGDEIVEPRLADESIVTTPEGPWLVLTDAESGDLLHDEPRTVRWDLTGSALGLATEGVAADHCEAEVPTPLPYAWVGIGPGPFTYTEADGSFVIPYAGPEPVRVRAKLDGQWFQVTSAAGNNSIDGAAGVSGQPVEILLNGANTELARAQVNAYVEANRVREFVLQHHPDFPMLDPVEFPISVNREDFPCPGNAWYDLETPSLNFCIAESGLANSAFTSVIHHEYGHHLVKMGGSGQGAYGEGMGDVMSVLVLQDPRIGLGLFGDCGELVRNAENDCQYDAASCSTCGSIPHLCGEVLSGAVWDTYNLLLATEPAEALDVISGLALGSILLHSGTVISPGITFDILTLDDDDGSLLNGTPHYAEIAAGFDAHGLDAPPVVLLEFVFPGGLPAFVSPGGGTTILVDVLDSVAVHLPATAEMLYDDGDGNGEVVVPMTWLGGGSYEATFPAGAECGVPVTFRFRADTTTGQTQTWPPAGDSGPPQPGPGGGGGQGFMATGADDAAATFGDDFETDLGWVVSGAPDDGAWERGVPAGDGSRGDPTEDADGSGQCFLTDNMAGNSDVDGAPTVLTSPALDATAPNAAIAYWRWFSNDVGAEPETEPLTVEISDDDGATWHVLETVGPTGPGTSGGWIERLVAFSQIPEIAPTATVRLRFTTQDPLPGSIVEAAVDGVRVLSLQCDAPCPGDCAQPADGQVDVSDLLALLALWGQPSPCDGDGGGVTDVADLLALLASWGPCG